MTRPLLLAAFALASSATLGAQPVAAGAKYVAMGSSYAAGPRIGTPADSTPARCARSRDNYAQQLARRRRLVLTDVSCSGATTAHLLGPWGELPPQLDAVDSATRLVTATIGGNDLGYMGVLAAGACNAAPVGRTCRPMPTPPSDSVYAALEARLTAIARAVKQRAPQSRFVFVQYFTVVPPTGSCAALPMDTGHAESARTMARRLAEVTARAAKAAGAEVLALDSLSMPHHACATEAWSNGDLGSLPPTDGVSFHPRLAGMTAAAKALDRMIWR